MATIGRRGGRSRSRASGADGASDAVIDGASREP
jgi:hypothetical protein